MAGFDERKTAAEGQFAHDKELEFKAQMRRDKLLGHWAGELMGLSGEELDAYAKSVIKADFEEPGDEDVFRKIRGDFDAKGIEKSDHQIRHKMEELLVEARHQIAETGG